MSTGQQTPYQKFKSSVGHLSNSEKCKLAGEVIDAMQLYITESRRKNKINEERIAVLNTLSEQRVKVNEQLKTRIAELERQIEFEMSEKAKARDKRNEAFARVAELESIIKKVKLIAEYPPKDLAILDELSKLTVTE